MAEVSIVIPLHNAEHTLSDCLDSVLSQTLGEIEVICVDDGSTDKSAAILEEYTRQDPRVRIIRRERGGPYAARNAALEAVAGEYLIFLDADDVADPHLIEHLYHRAEAEGADIAITGWDYLGGPLDPPFVDPDVRAWNLRAWRQKPYANGFPMAYGYLWMKLYRTRLIQEHQLRFREDFYSKADLIFHWLTMSLAEHVCVIPEPLYHYRLHEKSLTGRIGPRFLEMIRLMETLRDEMAAIGDPKGLLNSWAPFALGFIYSAYAQTPKSHRAEMREATRVFLGHLSPTERQAYQAPGQLAQEVRYFFRALDSPLAAIRYGSLFRMRRVPASALRRVLLPAPFKTWLLDWIRRQSYSLSHNNANQLSETVRELSDTLNRVAAENHRLRKKLRRFDGPDEASQGDGKPS